HRNSSCSGPQLADRSILALGQVRAGGSRLDVDPQLSVRRSQWPNRSGAFGCPGSRLQRRSRRLGEVLLGSVATVPGPHSSTLEASTRHRGTRTRHSPSDPLRFLLSVSLTFVGFRHSLPVHKPHVLIDNAEG